MSSFTPLQIVELFTLQGEAGKKGEKSESQDRPYCTNHGSECGGMNVGLLFFLYNFSRKLPNTSHPPPKILALRDVLGSD